MRSAIESAHLFPKGAGNCNCPVNKIRITPFMHDILDGHIRHSGVERIKIDYKVYLEEEPKSYRHRLAWAIEFGYMREMRAAIGHYQERNRGQTLCVKRKI